MCGIHLIISKNSSNNGKELSQKHIENMCDATTHRGKDGKGINTFFCQKNTVQLAHNRLKIIDFSALAAQPMSSDCGNYTLIFNGEIYNAHDLKKQLNSDNHTNYNWKSTSDTEVLLNWLIANQVDGISALQGMFAFVFLDKIKEKIYLARDKSGMKPLYYSQQGNYFLASSEIKAIQAAQLFPLNVDLTQIQDYLRYKYVRKPATFFREIKELPEKHYLEIDLKTDLNAEITPQKYFSQTKEYIDYQAFDIVSKVADLLQESIEKHLISDAKVGLMLSGGVDSTLLLALLQKAGKTQFSCFSIQFEEKDFATDDFQFAQKAAKQFGGELIPVAIDSNILHNYFSDIKKIDQPIADAAYCLTKAMAQKAIQQDVKVLFSGAGADEWFAGYNRHHAYYQYLKYMTAFPWDWLKKNKPMLPDGKSHPLREKFRKINRFVQKVEGNPTNTFLNFCTLTGFDEDCFKTFKKSLMLDELPQNPKLDDYLSQAFTQDIEHYLISDVLMTTDKAAMQAGVEVRMPYLDDVLLDFMTTVKPEKRIYKDRKWILNYLLELQGGEIYTKRSKAGLGLPLAAWLRKPEFEYILAWRKDAANPIFEVLKHEKAVWIYEQHQASKQDFSAELWAISVLYHFWK